MHSYIFFFTETANILKLLSRDEELRRVGSEVGGETSRLFDVPLKSFHENFSFGVCPIDSISSTSRSASRIPDAEQTFLEPIVKYTKM